MIDASDDDITFESMFGSIKPADRAKAREARLTKERRSQLTEKQLRRGAVRTTQLNFRCSPEFKAKADAMKDHLGAGWSIADIMEAALDMFAEAKGFKG